jgi:hypothetical protein
MRSTTSFHKTYQIWHYVAKTLSLRSITADNFFIGKGSNSGIRLTRGVWNDCGADLAEGRTQSAVSCDNFMFELTNLETNLKLKRILLMLE